MAKTKFRPLHDRVVVKRIGAEEKSKGGIIIPDTAQEKPSQGEVIAVGPGGRDETGKVIKPDVKSGDRVLFGKRSRTGARKWCARWRRRPMTWPAMAPPPPPCSRRRSSGKAPSPWRPA